jgi:phosphoribosylglycinamide formyltransferase-1
MLKIAVLASGNGSNLQAIIEAIEAGKLNLELACVISDKANAFALERARKHHIAAYAVSPKSYTDRPAHEKAIQAILEENGVQLIVLAGYMRILTPGFIQTYQHKIINIHPALLPSFPGAHGIRDAFEYGVKVTGVTVHFVDEGVDSGPIIAQVPVVVEEKDTMDTLEAKIHAEEHKLYIQALSYIAENRIQISGRRVHIS